MRIDEQCNYYESGYAEDMAEFICYKRAQGLKYDSVPRLLRSFSRYIVSAGAEKPPLCKELIDGWCVLHPNEKRTTQARRVVETAQFLKYLASKGIPVHLPRYPRRTQTASSFTPYIFTPNELQRFFDGCDHVRARRPSPMPTVLPVLFRLLLCCGLRISEALSLECHDVDLGSGILTIRQAKFNKDRLVPMSDSLVTAMRDYDSETHRLPTAHPSYFFTQKDGRPLTKDSVYRQFRAILWSAGIPHGGRGNGPRVHDFRHSFSVYSLKALTDRGMDIYCALPILSTYLGHASVSATEQYVRLTQDMFPEIISKASAIAAFVIPGGDSI
jgi:integrase